MVQCEGSILRELPHHSHVFVCCSYTASVPSLSSKCPKLELRPLSYSLISTTLSGHCKMKGEVAQNASFMWLCQTSRQPPPSLLQSLPVWKLRHQDSMLEVCELGRMPSLAATERANASSGQLLCTTCRCQGMCATLWRGFWWILLGAMLLWGEKPPEVPLSMRFIPHKTSPASRVHIINLQLIPRAQSTQHNNKQHKGSI